MQVVEVLTIIMLEAILKPNHKYTAHMAEEAK
jgi:hypothetical protein